MSSFSLRIFAFAIVVSAVSCRDASKPLTTAERGDGQIYFLAGGDHDHGSALYSVRPDGSNAKQLTDHDAAFVSSAHERLALTFNDDIVIAESDLSNRRVVASADGFDWHPKFSPDGRWVLFESQRESFRDLYKVELATDRVVRLTNNREGNFDAAWSPDGSRIAFASSRHGQLDLFVMNADGSNQRRLTKHPGDSIKPAWSADGKSIAFISGRDARDELYVVAVDGSDLYKLGDVPAHGRVERFAWHPTEPLIVFSVRTMNEGSKLRMAHSAKRRTWGLSKKSDDDFDPSWSPDGSLLVFARKRDGQNHLFLMRADGTRQTRLDIEATDAWLPRWFETRRVKGKGEA